MYEEGVPNTVYKEMRQYFIINKEAIGHVCTCSLTYRKIQSKIKKDSW
jgi:hypothetical protein